MKTNNGTFIKVRNNFTKKTPVSIGIKQKDSLNPILFNVITDEIIKEMKNTEDTEWKTMK